MERDSRIHLRNDAPNCFVSILYAIRAKKGLQHKRLGSGRKHAAGSGASKDDEASTDTGRAHKHRYARADKSLPTELAAGNQDGALQNDSVTKSSLRSRIKAKLSDEMSKKKGWHRRSNSLPLSAPSRRIDFSTNAGSTGFNFGLDMKDEGQKLTDDNPCGSSTTDSLVTDPTDESVKKNKMCELCAAKLSMSYWKRSEVNQEVRHSIECNPFLHGDIVHSERFSEGSSVQDLNQLTDGLDVFGPRKEFFLKILHDPGTPLLQYLHSREAFNSKIGLTRSKSFPLPGSVSRIVLESTNNYSKQGSASDANERENFQVCHRHNSVDITRTMAEPSIVERKEVGTSGPILGRHRSFNSLTPCSPRGFKIEHENAPVVKRFKRLKKKISQAIRESRKVKQHPVMNSVFQKVPCESNSSKVMQEETDNLQSDTNKCSKYGGSSSCEVDQSTSALRKDCDNHRFRRATSFGESIDRYSRLFECTFDRGARYPVSEKSTLRAENVPTPGKSSKKTLERLFSLPNLRSSFTLPMDSYQSPAEEPLKTSENHVGMAEPGMLDEKKPSDCSVDQESQKRLDPAEDCATVEDLKEYSEAPTQSVDLNDGETTSLFQDNLESTSVSSHSEPSPFYVADSDSKDITTSPSQLSGVEAASLTCEDNETTVVDTAVDIPKVESSLKQNYLEALQTQVDANHVSEFNYVKDILELSGFTGNKFLGTWNSTGQPVDPSVFEEVEGCPLTELDISEYEEVCSYNHLLMFDLINEILIEIHSRSSSYFPVHLTCRSHISPMPVGCHVLGEVWTNMKWHLSWRPESYQSLDDAVGRDLDRGDGWMNLQFDAECVGLEIEDMVFDDLIDEMLYDDLLEDQLWS